MMAKTTPTTARKVVTPGKAPAKKTPAKKKATPKTTTVTTPKGKDPLSRQRQRVAAAGSSPVGTTTANPLVSEFEDWLFTQMPDAKRKTVTVLADTVGGKPRAKSVNAMLTGLSQRDPDVIQALQERLYNAGFFGNADRKDIRWRDPRDVKTRQAYAWAIATAKQAQLEGSQLTLDEMLNEAAKYMSESARGGGGGGAVQPIRVTGEVELNKFFDDSVASVIGRALTAAEKAQLVAEFNAQEAGAQRSAYAGGTASAPDLESFTAARAKELDPEGHKLTNQINLGQKFYDMLGVG